MQASQAHVLDVGLQLIANSVSDSFELSMLNRWRKEYAAYKTRSERAKKVLDAIREGYDTLSEIAAATAIPQATCRRIVKSFVAKKRVRASRTKNSNHRIEIRFEIL